MTLAYISGRDSRLYYYESGFILNRADKATSPRKALAGTPQETRDITALVFFLTFGFGEISVLSAVKRLGLLVSAILAIFS